MSSTLGCAVPAPAPAPVDAWVSCTGEALAPNATDVLCTHTGTGDTWRGDLRGDLRKRLPCGEGTYVYANTQLKVEGTICGSMDALKFDGEGSMQWPDGSRYDGDLKDSRFDGQGTFAWANGERYAGAWRGGQRHGRGKLETWNKSLLQSTAIEGKVNSMVYEGEWENDLMHGDGTMKYYGLPEEKCSAGVDAAMTGETASKHGRLLRSFEGCFERGFPRNGGLKTESEDFAQVHFDGLTPVSDFAAWYWTPDDESKAPGTKLVDLEPRGEEFRAVQYQAGISMPTLPPHVIGIQRVENDDRRVMYDLQLRHVKNRVKKRRTSTAWTHTMEGFAFHAPGSGVPKISWGGGCNGVPPWQSIVEEGFVATLSGSDHGRVYGAGIYFARDLLLAHKYAAHAAHRLEADARAGAQKDADEQPLLVFLCRIVKGVYTVGAPGMNIPPLDPNGAKGEHFHSLVDNTTNPKIFVINDNTRAYPAYLIKYSREVEKTLPSGWSGMPTAGRGAAPSVAAGRGMYAPSVAGGRGMYAPSVAAGRGMYAQGVAGGPTAGRGASPSVAAGGGMYAQGGQKNMHRLLSSMVFRNTGHQGVAAVSAAGRGGPPSTAAGRGMYAPGSAAVFTAGRGAAVVATGGDTRTLQSGGDGSSGSKRRRASKAATDARVLAKPRWAKKRNAEQGVIVISDDEEGN